jgi:Mrp family chromosome partitioning ATPase
MTALDQAIIKAYLRQGGLPTPDEVESPEPVCLGVAPQEPLRAPRQPEPKPEPAREVRPASVPLDAFESTGTGLPLDIATAIERPDSVIGRAGSPPLGNVPAPPDLEVQSSHTATCPSGRAFEPLLRVDAISWPRPSRRLRHVASGQIERLADAVRKASASGGKLIGVAASSHGEGCTTVLLAVAIRLVELGQKTLLVDGDIVKPRLAEQLALANEMGWRDVAVGSIPLEDAVTQSESESLALLPYCGQATPMDGPEPTKQAISALLERLRAHYDMILVDLGGAITSGNSDGTLAERLAEQLDSVLAVQNVQLTSPSNLAELRQHLRRLGVEETGIIENFVDDGVA